MADGNHASVLLTHFIGATPESTEWVAMLRRIIGELNRRLHLHMEVPGKPEALRVGFAEALHAAAAKGRLIMVLDGLDGLQDRDGERDLGWLPPVIPENIRLVLSTSPGRTLDGLRKRRWATLDRATQARGVGNSSASFWRNMANL